MLLRNKLLIWFLSFSFILIVIILPTSFIYFKSKQKIHNTLHELEEMQILILKSFKIHSDFFNYEQTNPVFFQTNKSIYINQSDSVYQVISNYMEQFRNSKDNDYPALNKKIDRLNYFIDSYFIQYKNIIQLIYYRGYKDYGVVGKMRDYVHELEKFTGIDQEKVLSLRRHEKDYIIRNEPVYIEKLNTLCNLFITEINESQLNTAKKKEIILLLHNYQKNFNTLVDLDEKIGVRSNQALKYNLEQTSLKIENLYSEFIHEANLIKLKKMRNLERNFILFGFSLIILSIFGSYYISRSITHPFYQLVEDLRQFIEKNTYPVKKKQYKNIKEISYLYNSILALINKISKREEERDKAVEALKESQLKYQEMADLLPQTIYETDEEGNFIYVNKAWYSNFLYQESDMQQGLNISDIIINDFNGLIFTDKLKGIEFITERKDGSVFPSLVYSDIVYKDGKIQGFRGIIIDITERKQYIEKLEHEKHRAEQADKLKSAFLANMSHEIRTPMNAILGFSDLLKDKDLNDEDKEKFINYINSNGESLLNLIDEIIDTAKIETGQIKIQKQDTNVSEILKELHLSFIEIKKQLGKHEVGLRYEHEMNQSNLKIHTDPYRFRQIFSNLIFNALKFTDAGEVSFGYKINSKSYITFFVSDTGIGISNDKIETIFERFSKIDHSNPAINPIGAGLGLAITKKLVELLGGKIHVRSTLEVGSTFSFTLPSENLKTFTAEKKAMVHENKEYNWIGKHILIAEDDKNSFLYLKNLLRKTAINITWAKTGAEAIQLFENNSFDLILTDVKMPDMDGYTATQKIKEIKPAIPVIVQTAYALNEDKQKSFNMGCDDYIAKPIKSKALLSILDKYLVN